jgi:hypothetical protein
VNIHAGYDPGLIRDPGGLAITEYIEHPREPGQTRRPIVAYLVEAASMPLEAAGGSYHDQMETIARHLAPLGPDVWLTYDATGSGGPTFTKEVIDGIRRGLFAHAPRGVRIRGGDGSSDTSIGKTTLFKNLREMVLTKRLLANPATPGWADLQREALTLEPEFSPKNETLTFNAKGPGAHDDMIFALALAVFRDGEYSGINNHRAGIRYRDVTGRIWSSFEEASGNLGQRVEEHYFAEGGL